MAKSQVPRAGSVWAVPLKEAGWCSAVVARVQDGSPFFYAYILPAATPEPVPGASVSIAADWGEAWTGLVSVRAFARWTPCGSISGFDPDDWPIPPVRLELDGRFSIGTRPDEPTMTLIANEPAPPDEAAVFPTNEVAVAPSMLETSLRKLVRGASFMFSDMAIRLVAIDQAVLDTWTAHNEAVRSSSRATLPEGLPPGRKTDRELRSGALLALPLPDGGFGAAMFLARQPDFLRAAADGLVLGLRKKWTSWPTFAEVAELSIDDGVVIAQASMICVRDGWWRVLGYVESTGSSRWVLPVTWKPVATDRARPFRKRRTTTIAVERSATATMRVDVPAEVVESDLEAGQCWRGLGGHYGSIETGISNPPEFVPNPTTRAAELRNKQAVTRERIAVWRAVESAAREAAGLTASDPSTAIWLG